MTTPPMSETSSTVARVLLDSPLPQLDHLFDYSVPTHLVETVRIGHRVKVPFRSRQRDTTGTVIELTNESDFSGQLAQISEIVSPIPLLTAEVWALIRAAADRAGGNAADILRLAIPNRYVRVEKRYLAEPAESEDAPTLTFDDEERARSKELISGARLSLKLDLAPVRLPDGEWVGAWAHDFARTAAAVQSHGHSVIIVVPDYRDVDQVHDALSAFGLREHVRLDSRQSPGDRYLNFLRALEEKPRIILGNRSAIYAPAHRLGAVLIWDDGDPLLNEPLSPYVHARDAALIRTRQTGSGLLLGAHSRSAEAQRLIQIGYLAARERTGAKRRIMHTGSMLSTEASFGRIPELATSTIREHLSQGPVLVQVASRGYAPVVACARCHDRAGCRACTGPLMLAKNGRATCRWCGTAADRWSCPTCGEYRMEARGAGSERTVEQFQRMFPSTRVILSDGEHRRSRVDARPALVVATRGAEPVAAGGYRAVVLLDVDTILRAETLRAGEDAMRWWCNAVSLASDGAPCVMTGGGGPIVRAFVTGRVEDWLLEELRDRQLLRFPPAVRVASVTGAPDVVDAAVTTVTDIPSVDVLGPASLADGVVRSIVRFGYDDGAEVASRLRAVLVTNASESQARQRLTSNGGRRRGAPPGALRLRFDDRDAFDEPSGDSLTETR